MDLSQLAVEWEACEEVRKVAREHGVLLKFPSTANFCESNRPNAINNAAVLHPCLKRLRDSGMKLPYLEPLQAEVNEFFKAVHMVVSEKVVYRTANELKKMLSFLKRKANKREVTKVGCGWKCSTPGCYGSDLHTGSSGSSVYVSSCLYTYICTDMRIHILHTTCAYRSSVSRFVVKFILALLLAVFYMYTCIYIYMYMYM